MKKPGSFIIPKELTLQGSQIKIVRSTEILADDGDDGKWIPRKQTIHIPADCKEVAPSHVMQVYCHELAHVMLEAGPDPSLSEDEAKVECYGRVLMQLLLAHQ